MPNKENDQSTIAKKKINLVIAVVVLLMLLSFIVLKINNGGKQSASVDTAKGPVAAELQGGEAGTSSEAQEKKVNVSDIVSAEKLAQTEEIQPIAKDDHIIGSTAEPVKLIVYSDFECAYCAQFAETVKQARKEFGDKLAVVFRHYPLVDAHPNSLLAAEASECAADQGKFWEMHDALFAAERAGSLNADTISTAADNVRLSKTDFLDCIAKSKYREKILDEVKEAKAATVSGSPTAFINGELITGANPYEDGTRSDGSKLEGLKTKIQRKLEGK
jgi:protein-disulfide isomerase